MFDSGAPQQPVHVTASPHYGKLRRPTSVGVCRPPTCLLPFPPANQCGRPCGNRRRRCDSATGMLRRVCSGSQERSHGALMAMPQICRSRVGQGRRWLYPYRGRGPFENGPDSGKTFSGLPRWGPPRAAASLGVSPEITVRPV